MRTGPTATLGHDHALPLVMMANVVAIPSATTTFRRGVAAPEKSSLSVFVFIGLAVGLFAFALMTYCLPDPVARIAAREAASATFPPPPVRSISALPPEAPRPVIDAAPVVVVTPPTATLAKARAPRRPTPAPKKAKTPQLPANPYGA